jgi:cysteine desulfurase/selenocysteine lyase
VISLNYRKDFNVFRNNNNLAYLDNAAMALKPDCVVNAIDNYYKNYGVNVHRGVYQLSYEATDLYEEARTTIAKFINASFEEVVFTRGASASLNLVAQSYGMSFINEGDEVITTELEHHSSHMPWINVCKAKNAVIKYVPLDSEGRITVENFKKVLTNKTKLVAMTYVSNVMGYITPIKEIIKLAHEVGAVVSVDGAQAVPHMKVDVKDLDCDFLSFSGHKLCGPTGIGVLYGKLDLLEKMPPIEFGGDMADTVLLDSQTYKAPPYKFETGTPIIAGAIGLAQACKYLESIGFENIINQEKKLRLKAIEELKKIDGVIIYNESCETGVISFNLEGIHPHDAASVFDNNDVCIRAGHHCAQLITKKLGTIGTIRASFYFYNREEDIDKFIKAVKEAKDFFGQF